MISILLEFESNIEKDNSKEWKFYVAIFFCLLIVSIIIFLVIVYFIRHKKKSYFDAACRRYIESIRDYDRLIDMFNEIILNDDYEYLEKLIISNIKFLIL